MTFTETGIGSGFTPAVENTPLRKWEMPLVEQTPREFVPVVVLIAADLTLDLETLDFRIEDEVDDTSNGV